MNAPLRIGTRGSPLALWQANHVAALLRPLVAPRAVELIEITTLGDTVRDRALTQIGGDGVFTKEIQNALLANAVDVAVHSLKDLPTTHFPGLTLAAVPPRGPCCDALISTRHADFAALPPGAVVGTSSLRRRAQLLHRRSDLRLENLRGNVDSRLRKLDEQGLDAIVLAQAGLARLGMSGRITEILPLDWMLPAVGQGALGLECRTEDAETQSLLAPLDDAVTHQAVLAERAMLRGLGGGCQVPIGARTIIAADVITLHGVVLSPDGSQRIAERMIGPVAEAPALGQRLAEALLAHGARKLLS